MFGWFKIKKYQFFCATATLIGMIVGAGTFGIPYVVAQAGFGLGFFYLMILGAAVVLVHLFYSEIILRTHDSHRLVGYADKYLGNWAKKLTTLTILIEYYGAMLAYIILGGSFLAIVFSRWLDGTEIFWVLVFFVIGALAIFCGLKTVSQSELIMSLLLVLAVAILVFKSAPVIKWENFLGFNLKSFFLPYGVILFAMAGSAAIPEMRQIMRGNEGELKRAIIWGTFIPVILYFFFAWAVVGVSGLKTSEDAIGGLVPYLGRWVVDLGALFGLLAVFTSFLVLGFSLKQVFHQDWRLKEKLSFFLVLAGPLLAYFLGLKNFIKIIGFVGAVAAGLDSILTILIYFKAKKKGDRQPEYSFKKIKFLGALLVFIFALGLIYQFIYLAGK